MTAKHFPGLGHVTANTDTTSGVKDTVTTRTSADLAPFRSAITAGARIVMVSSAVYTKIDAARPAVFSPTVINGMIRHDLGFSGVVISDDLGNAKQVRHGLPARGRSTSSRPEATSSSPSTPASSRRWSLR